MIRSAFGFSGAIAHGMWTLARAAAALAPAKPLAAAELSANAAIEAQVPNALVEMGVAAAVLPILCVFAALARWRRTR